MTRYRTDPLYDIEASRHRHRNERAFDREREMRGSWKEPPFEREPTIDEMRMSREPWPYSPYATAPVPGTPGWHPPHLEGYYSDDHDPSVPEWNWRERDLRDRISDEIATWFGDPDAARRRKADYTGVGPRNYQRPDSRINDDLHDRLTDDPIVDASEITVKVLDGEVTLDGEVDTLPEKRRAEDCADHVRGVGHVQNNLRVRNR
ncbi:BON domain-containing protein [Defluviimonas sp. WL0002]|uniref:BON domain-containing protein n=1 Tax=Albidovulum marisflavi TaxID=2984159 RepID=A0ABT2ZDD8_9RHOB|nr:BON domain-containing protein [Defluviimonas sp. WL0002]MCV2869091.1 BON domain-containing protein [Defluviimonas sp. WL0002]